MNGRTAAEQQYGRPFTVDYYEDAARAEMEAAAESNMSGGFQVARAQVWATLALAAATDEARRSATGNRAVSR